MAISKYILKKSRRQAAVKIVSTDANTINITYADVKYADQTIPNATAGNLFWPITDILYDVPAPASIVRGGNLVFSMSAGQESLSFTRDLGVALDEQAHANVTINTGAGNSSIIVVFTKGEGFNDPNRQILEDKDR